MTLVKEVANGKMYIVKVPNNGNPSNYTVVHLWGDAQQWGTAQGELLGSTLINFLTSTWSYFQEQIDQVIPYLPVCNCSNSPQGLQNEIATIGLDAALDATYYASVEYTDPDIYTELQAMVTAAGGDSSYALVTHCRIYWIAVKVHMIAGLTQGACSMFGAWGDAVANGASAGHVIQLRALDWDMDGPFRDFSQITVYHPAEGLGNAFASVGMSGFLGGLTGLSEVTQPLTNRPS